MFPVLNIAACIICDTAAAAFFFFFKRSFSGSPQTLQHNPERRPWSGDGLSLRLICHRRVAKRNKRWPPAGRTASWQIWKSLSWWKACNNPSSARHQKIPSNQGPTWNRSHAGHFLSTHFVEKASLSVSLIYIRLVCHVLLNIHAY